MYRPEDKEEIDKLTEVCHNKLLLFLKCSLILRQPFIRPGRFSQTNSLFMIWRRTNRKI